MPSVIIRFQCTASDCGSIVEEELWVAEPYWGAEVMSEGDVVEDHDVMCNDCDTEYHVETVHGIWGIRASVTGHLADPKRAWGRIRLDATVSLLRANENLCPLIAETDKEHKEYLGQLRWLKRLQKKAEAKNVTLPVGLMDVHLHDLRRTLGSFQAITGASLQVIGKSLGHKSQAATQIYARLHHDPVRNAVERATDAMFEHALRA